MCCLYCFIFILWFSYHFQKTHPFKAAASSTFTDYNRNFSNNNNNNMTLKSTYSIKFKLRKKKYRDFIIIYCWITINNIRSKISIINCIQQQQESKRYLKLQFDGLFSLIRKISEYNMKLRSLMDSNLFNVFLLYLFYLMKIMDSIPISET